MTILLENIGFKQKLISPLFCSEQLSPYKIPLHHLKSTLLACQLKREAPKIAFSVTLKRALVFHVLCVRHMGETPGRYSQEVTKTKKKKPLLAT